MSEAGSVSTRGESEGERIEVTDFNVLQVLGVIEQEVSEMLLSMALSARKRGEDASFLFAAPHAPRSEQGGLKPPSLLRSEDDLEWSDDDDDDDGREWN